MIVLVGICYVSVIVSNTLRTASLLYFLAIIFGENGTFVATNLVEQLKLGYQNDYIPWRRVKHPSSLTAHRREYHQSIQLNRPPEAQECKEDH
jgi:hypothetical protein